MCSQIGEGTIDVLDSTHDSITALRYDVGEIWNAAGVFEDVDRALKVAKAVLEKRTELLFETQANKVG
ncbi:hypothetical protein [Parapedobacter tibetensis]|uniref:hypothetical protein n=1 Tax=Parapedobacter tibetensis TaxID=2972951 RepID=UPI00214DD37F|nr:hypothetical protein [Parapedobacter tibetensis]